MANSAVPGPFIFFDWHQNCFGLQMYPSLPQNLAQMPSKTPIKKSTYMLEDGIVYRLSDTYEIAKFIQHLRDCCLLKLFVMFNSFYSEKKLHLNLLLLPLNLSSRKS